MFTRNQKVRLIESGPLQGLTARVVRVSVETSAVTVELLEGRGGWLRGAQVCMASYGLAAVDEEDTAPTN